MVVQLEIEKRRFICKDCEKNKWWKDQFWNEIKWSTFYPQGAPHLRLLAL